MLEFKQSGLTAARTSPMPCRTRRGDQDADTRRSGMTVTPLLDTRARHRGRGAGKHGLQEKRGFSSMWRGLARGDQPVQSLHTARHFRNQFYLVLEGLCSVRAGRAEN